MRTSVNLLVCMSVRYITMGVVWYIYSCAYMTASEEWCIYASENVFVCAGSSTEVLRRGTRTRSSSRKFSGERDCVCVM